MNENTSNYSSDKDKQNNEEGLEKKRLIELDNLEQVVLRTRDSYRKKYESMIDNSLDFARRFDVLTDSDVRSALNKEEIHFDENMRKFDCALASINSAREEIYLRQKHARKD